MLRIVCYPASRRLAADVVICYLLSVDGYVGLYLPG